MRVLVTGALGHVGSALIRRAAGWDMTLLDNLSTQRFCSLFDLPAPVRFVQGDIMDADLDALVAGQDAVVHLAALTDAEASVADPEAYYRVNWHGTRRVAEACIRHGARLVFPSTTSVYGEQDGPVDETLEWDKYNPQSPYAKSKFGAEHDLNRLYGPEGLKYTILRFGTIYGTSPGMRFHTAVNKFCWQAAHGQPLTVWRTAWDTRRPYLALPAAVDYLQWAADGYADQTTYNVVSGNHTVREVVDAIRQFLPDLVVRETDAPILNQRSYEVRARLAPTGYLSWGVMDTLFRLRPDWFTRAAAEAAA